MHANVAQLVEHNLAKVGVAGSNPVVRSKASGLVLEVAPPGRVAEWLRQGTANPCTRVRFPPRPLTGFSFPSTHNFTGTGDWRSLVARFPDTEEVTGSSPVSPTPKTPGQGR